jgi:hypothetical protein
MRAFVCLKLQEPVLHGPSAGGIAGRRRRRHRRRQRQGQQPICESPSACTTFFFLYLQDWLPRDGNVLILGVQVEIKNGIFELTLSNPDGIVTGVRYNGVDNLMEILNKEDNRGYGGTNFLLLFFFALFFYCLHFCHLLYSSIRLLLIGFQHNKKNSDCTLFTELTKRNAAACSVRYWDLVWNPPGQKTGIFDV